MISRANTLVRPLGLAAAQHLVHGAADGGPRPLDGRARRRGPSSRDLATDHRGGRTRVQVGGKGRLPNRTGPWDLDESELGQGGDHGDDGGAEVRICSGWTNPCRGDRLRRNRLSLPNLRDRRIRRGRVHRRLLSPDASNPRRDEVVEEDAQRLAECRDCFLAQVEVPASQRDQVGIREDQLQAVLRLLDDLLQLLDLVQREVVVPYRYEGGAQIRGRRESPRLAFSLLPNP